MRSDGRRIPLRFRSHESELPIVFLIIIQPSSAFTAVGGIETGKTLPNRRCDDGMRDYAPFREGEASC